MNPTGSSSRLFSVKPWGYALYVGLFAVGVGASCFVSGPMTEVVVSDPDMSAEELVSVARQVGVARSVEPDGFLIVRARGSFESAQRRLQGLGIDYVFRASARDVIPTSLTSVSDHVAFQKAKKRMMESEEEDGEDDVAFYEALKFYLERRVEADGEIDQDRWRRAATHREQMPKWRPKGKAALAPTGPWENIGPFGLDTPYRTYYGVPPLSGRKTHMAYAPSNTNIIYAVSGGSGIWKSEDGGTNWTPKSDGWQFLQGNCVAVDPLDPNIVYVGTGDYKQGGFSFGLMKSTNGGNTWTNYGAAEFGAGMLQKIVIDPTNRNTLVACVALGGDARGIWRSTNAGVSWTQVQATGLSMTDLEISANSGGRTWWCVAGSGVTGGRIYKSNDAITWTQVTSPSGSTETRMDVACSKVNRDTVYLLATGAEQVYKTTNAGASWVSVKNNFPNGSPSIGANYNWSQKTYDYHISTTKSGTNDVIMVGLITIAASFNGGTTWSDIGVTYTGSAKTHNDQHSFANHPTDDNTVLFGNDGGIWRCLLNPTAENATFTSLNNRISDEMFYAIALHPTNANRIMGGTQDNASPASRGNLAQWDNLYAGDGAWCAFDRNNPQIHYTSSQGLSVYRYTSDDDPSPTGISPNWNAAFIAPLIIAGDGSELFAATSSNLQKWTGSGSGWTQSAQNVGGGGTVTYLAASPSNGSVIYTGANNGQVWRTPDEGGSFTRVDAGLPDSGVGAITVSLTDPNNVLVAVGNSGGLYRCTNTTAASPVWTSISGSGGTALPSVPVNAIAFDPNDAGTIYAGTDVGLFISTDDGGSWANMNASGLPNVMVSDLEINQNKTHLYVGTYGRGIWRVAIEQESYSVTGWVRQNGTGIPNTSVRLMQGNTVVKTAIPDTNGNYTISAEVGSYTLVPFHNDKVFFPATRDITVPPAQTAQNFTAGNIGPVSISWQYQPVVYSDQGRQGTLGLNIATPIDRDITMSDNSFKLTSPVKVKVLAGQRTATFFVYGVTVTADTLAMVTASHEGLTASATITVRPKPALNAMTLAKSTIKGGIGVSGTVTINKPAIGPMGLTLESSNTSVATITPNPTAYYNGVSSKAFYCKTFPVGSTQVVTFTARFYGSTRTVNLTVTP